LALQLSPYCFSQKLKPRAARTLAFGYMGCTFMRTPACSGNNDTEVRRTDKRQQGDLSMKNDRPHSFRIWVSRALFGWVLAAACAAAHADRSGFTVHELTLGGSYCKVLGIRNGVAVGEADLPGNQQRDAFAWTPTQGMRDLGTLEGGAESSPSRIHQGLIAGWSATNGSAIRTRRPVAWLPSGQIIDLIGTPYDIDSEGWYAISVRPRLCVEVSSRATSTPLRIC
jgi:probable HAF family extracellular repeat protein